MTPLQRFVQYLTILNVILNILTFSGIKPNVKNDCTLEKSNIVSVNFHQRNT